MVSERQKNKRFINIKPENLIKIVFDKNMSKVHDIIHERFPLILVLLFILSSAVAFALTSDTKEIIDIIIDVFGILVGIISIFLILNIAKSFKGSLRTSFNYIIYGVSFQVLALLEDALKDLGVYSPPEGISIHHFIMIIGIALFTIAAFKLRNMLTELNKKS